MGFVLFFVVFGFTDDLEKKYDKHDRQMMGVFDAIRQLMARPVKEKRKIGFKME